MSDCPQEMVAGSIKPRLELWEDVTSDPNVLQNVEGIKIQFDSPPFQDKVPREYKFNEHQKEFIEKEIFELLDKNVIVEIEDVSECFVSNIFLRPKPDNKFRMIIDLSDLNKFVTHNHFKMDTLDTATELMFPGAWMASIDLKEAYYAIPVSEADQKFLVFQWEKKFFKFTCMPFGLSSAPWIFTKTLRPIFAEFHKKGHMGFGYIDDSFIIGESFQKCEASVKFLYQMFQKLGFRVHERKSILTPCKEIKFLGYILNSKDMSVTPSEDKKVKVKEVIQNLLRKEKPKIRTVASVIGLLNDLCKGSDYGQNYTKSLEIQKIKYLRWSKNMGFDGHMKLSQACKDDLNWWLSNIDSASKKIILQRTKMTLQTDASNLGWGACSKGQSTGGRWSSIESEDHINVLELKAIQYGLLSLCKDKKNQTIKILCDNTTSVAYVAHKGGTRSTECNFVAHEIWKWCEDRNIYIIISYLPGVENVVADYESRNFTEDTEWQLNPHIFKQACKMWGSPDIDMFASKNNFQLSCYASWGPDPFASFVNAFTIYWGEFELMYLFPPFRLIGRVLQKLRADKGRAILVAPIWTAQTWFPMLENMARDSWTIPRRMGNLRRTDKGPRIRDTLQNIALRLYLL